VVPAKWFGIGTEKYQKSDLSPAQADLIVQNVNDDSDADGIPNWKESLLGTNPSLKNKVPVAQTETTPLSAEEKKSQARLDDPKNLTSQYIKNTVGLSTYLTNQGVTDEATLAQVSNNIIDETEKLNDKRIFTRSNLTSITNNESLSVLKTYGNAAALIIGETYQTLNPDAILDDLQSYTITKDPKKLQDYGPKATFISDEIKKLIVLPVPDSAVESHIYALNALEAYRVTLLNLSNAEEDPMRGIIAINSYKDSYTALVNSVFILADYFSTKGVVFGLKENGSLFTQVILKK
jgi:hypothetical protein